MRKLYIKIITALALLALISAQGIWLYSTYILLHANLIAELEEGFARSIEKEVYLRFDINKDERKKGSAVEGIKPDNDFYSNALAFHEDMLSWGFPLSMEKLDSIWSQKLMENYGTVKYLLLKTDSTGIPTETINRGAKENSRYTFTVEKPIRKNHSEYLSVIIESPHKIVFARMMFLLITSLIIAIILGYSLFFQIRMIVRLERIAAVRQDFTQAMVHDIKSPVTNILVSANTLKSGKLDSKIQMKERYFDILTKEGNRLLAFSNKILTIAKIEESKIELAKCEIDLKELFDGLIEEYLLSPAKEILFTTDLADDSTVYADPEYLTDVFRNLIDNAIKYSRETVAIHIKTAKQKNGTEIRIKDDGIGIALKDQKRIFNKFERISSREKEKKTGFGLGLYYVYQVVFAHGGTVSVQSIPDMFSEFTVFIPNKKL